MVPEGVRSPASNFHRTAAVTNWSGNDLARERRELIRGESRSDLILRQQRLRRRGRVGWLDLAGLRLRVPFDPRHRCFFPHEAQLTGTATFGSDANTT
jgi:hypothetical protein